MTTELADDVGFEESPADESTDTQQTSTTAKPGLALVMQKNLTRIQTAMADLDRIESELPEVEKQFPKDVVYEITTPKGMKSAIEHRAAWRDRRITVDKAREMAKAPILELGRHVDARAKRLEEQLRSGEEPIHKLIKTEEDRKAAERQARINAEAGRVLAIQEALAGIGEDVLIACGKASPDIQALIDRMSTTQPDPLMFQEQIDQARASWAAGLAKLDTALKAKLWEEEQARQREAERAAESARRVQAEADAARLRRETAAQQLALQIGSRAMEMMGKPAAEIGAALKLLQATVYAPELEEAEPVIKAHVAALATLAKLLTTAQQHEEREAELATLRAAAAPKPVEPPAAPAPAQAEPSETAPPPVFDSTVGGPVADGMRSAEPDSVESFTHSMPLETSEDDAQPAAPAVVMAALANALPAHRLDALGDPLLMEDVRSFVAHVLEAFETKFPTQPKPGVEWWSATRAQAIALQQQLTNSQPSR